MLLINKTNEINETAIMKGIKIFEELTSDNISVQTIYDKNKSIFYDVKDFIDTIIFLYLVNKISIEKKDNQVYVSRVEMWKI